MIDSTTKGVEWEKVTTDKMFKLVCEAMKKTIEDNPPDISTEQSTKIALLLARNLHCKKRSNFQAQLIKQTRGFAFVF